MKTLDVLFSAGSCTSTIGSMNDLSSDNKGQDIQMVNICIVIVINFVCKL